MSIFYFRIHQFSIRVESKCKINLIPSWLLTFLNSFLQLISVLYLVNKDKISRVSSKKLFGKYKAILYDFRCIFIQFLISKTFFFWRHSPPELNLFFLVLDIFKAARNNMDGYFSAEVLSKLLSNFRLIHIWVFFINLYHFILDHTHLASATFYWILSNISETTLIH
jgi:hypothetical protein